MYNGTFGRQLNVNTSETSIDATCYQITITFAAYLQPFVDTLSSLSNFTIKSQWKYQVAFEFPSNQKRDNSTLGRHYSLSSRYLPHIITSIEKRLGNSIHDNPCIHLVVYVPPCESSPLFIYNNKDERITDNEIDSFISPKWGGIVVANPKEIDCVNFFDNNSEKMDIHINMDEIMPILLHQLKRLIGVDSKVWT